jgi:hypothetical protein
VTNEKVAGGALAAQPPRIRRVWYRPQPSLCAMLAPTLVLLVLVTVVGVYSFGGPARLGLILGGVELLAVLMLTAALSPVIMLRPDLVRIWLAAEILPKLDSDSIVRLPNLRESAEHLWGWVVGHTGFHELVIIDRASATLTLLVASDD